MTTDRFIKLVDAVNSQGDKPSILIPQNGNTDELYIMISDSGLKDAAFIANAVNAEVLGFRCVNIPPRAAADIVFRSLPKDINKKTVIVCPPSHVQIQDEIARRLNPDLVYVTPAGEWGEYLNLVSSPMSNRLRELLSSVRRQPIASVIDSHDLVSAAIDQYRTPDRVQGLLTGWTTLDRLYRPAPGYVTVITGVPSHGKSTWLDALLTNLSILHDTRHAIFSPESYPVSRHALRIASRLSTIPWIGQQKMSENECRVAMSWVSEHFHFLDPDVSLDVESILDAAGKILRRHGINSLIIDPWNEIEHSRPRELTETEYISLALARIRRWARTHNVHVFLVAHPAKPPKHRDDEDGPYIPTPYDISGSANWYNKADCALTVWRDPEEVDGVTQVHVQKIRVQPEHGNPGVACFKHEKSTGRYRDIDIALIGKPDAVQPKPGIPLDYFAKLVKRGPVSPVI